MDTSPDRYISLMGKDHGGKRNTVASSICCLNDQIIILRKQHTPDACRTIEKVRVGYFVESVLIRRKYIDVPQPQTKGNGTGDVVIHVELDAHMDYDSDFNRTSNGATGVDARKSSTR